MKKGVAGEPPVAALNGGKKTYLVGGQSFEVDERYEIRKAVGTGSYGTVCPAVDLSSGTKVAIKKIRRLFDNLADGKRALREIMILAMLSHKNIIGIREIMMPRSRRNFDDLYIVTDLMDSDLNVINRSSQKLSPDHVQWFMYQAMCGLKYAHSAGIVHRDIKPGNLLVNQNCELVICDFGLARGVDADDGDLTTYVVTRWYRAPELLLQAKQYSPAVDIWAMGCVFAELIKRGALFPGRDYLNQLNLIIDYTGSPTPSDLSTITRKEPLRYLANQPKRPARNIGYYLPPRTSPDTLDILTQLLYFDPKKRPTADAALEHPYFAEVRCERDETRCPIRFQWARDSKDLTADELRAALWKEVCRFHPKGEDSEDEDSG